ncbi:MAG: hypothetical protein R3E84_19480 [Pseudomonadales bacterium]
MPVSGIIVVTRSRTLLNNVITAPISMPVAMRSKAHVVSGNGWGGIEHSGGCRYRPAIRVVRGNLVGTDRRRHAGSLATHQFGI